MLFKFFFVALMATSAMGKALHCRKHGEKKCGSPPTCVNVQTDPNNCGTCGNVCPTDYSCSAGTCTVPSDGCTQASSCGNNFFCNSDESCICRGGSSGQVHCITTGVPCEGAQYCTVDSDCSTSPGGFCGQNTCCEDGNGNNNVCIYNDTCTDPGSPSKMFRRGPVNVWTTDNAFEA